MEHGRDRLKKQHEEYCQKLTQAHLTEVKELKDNHKREMERLAHQNTKGTEQSVFVTKNELEEALEGPAKEGNNINEINKNQNDALQGEFQGLQKQMASIRKQIAATNSDNDVQLGCLQRFKAYVDASITERNRALVDAWAPDGSNEDIFNPKNLKMITKNKEKMKELISLLEERSETPPDQSQTRSAGT